MSAAVSWAAPDSGSSAITQYTVRATPGGLTCATSTTNCVVINLTNGTPYVFTVRATSAAGTGPSSAASNTVVPAVPRTTGLNPITPVRLFDSRTTEPNGAATIAKGRFGPNRELRVTTTGIAGIPTNATAISLNLTTTGSTAPGYITVYPCGNRPNTSNLNYTAGQTIANSVLTALSPTGEICIYASSDTDILADINTWAG